MPIFEKDGREILFAHIPKTGGTSIYLAFAAAGWRVINLQPREDPQSAFHALREQFGVDRIEQRGLRIRRLGPVQHMPSAVWRLWGPFEESFAIVRHPVARLESAIAYHHRLQRISEPLPDFAARVLSSAQKKILGPWRTLGGHLIPQNRFVLKDTRIFHFEEDWVQALCDRYGLDAARFPKANAGRTASRGFLTALQTDWARSTYRKDFATFGYE